MLINDAAAVFFSVEKLHYTDILTITESRTTFGVLLFFVNVIYVIFKHHQSYKKTGHCFNPTRGREGASGQSVPGFIIFYGPLNLFFT